MTRLLYLVGCLLVLGFAWSMVKTVPAIYGSGTAPVQDGDLWRMNPE